MIMKTVVYQSYKTTGVPQWIERCMDTVKKWASKQGYDYRFYDDEVLNLYQIGTELK